MRILLTRPRDDAERTAAALRARGHEVVLAPLMEVRFRDGPEIAFDGVQAILVTSANGIRALARRSTRRDVPVLAVGPQTAEAARAAGFTDVRSADGDAAALAEATQRWLGPHRGALLHARGVRSTPDLARALEQAGFAVRGEVLYDAVAAPDLPAPAAMALRDGALDAVMVFSPRSAAIFAETVGRAGLAATCGRLDALCISQAAADALAPLAFAAIRIAARPNQAAMLDLAG